MARANPKSPIYEFDPEIERTQRGRQQRARQLIVQGGSKGQNLMTKPTIPIYKAEPTFPSRGSNHSSHSTE
ncbi:hypothetical protein GQ457_14G014510 [Hibiscus cannabinus]